MANSRGSFKKIDLLGTKGQTLVSASEIVIDKGRVILKGKGFKLLPHQVEIDGVAYMTDGIVPFKAVVTLSTEKQINLEVTSAASKTDRRDMLKVPTNAKESVIEVRGTGKNGKHYLLLEDEIQLQNLSMGGIGFLSNRPYFKNQKITVQLAMIRQDFVIEAQILRRKRQKFSLSGRAYRYCYGAKFLCNNEAKNRMLCEHVFKLEMLNKQNEDARNAR